MSLTNITLNDLPKIERLLGQKERYRGELADINRQLERFEAGESSPAAPQSKAPSSPSPKKAKRRGRSNRMDLKQEVPSVLKSAGKNGLHVRDIANRLGAKESNIRIWLYRGGAKIKQIKQVGPGTFAWKG